MWTLQPVFTVTSFWVLRQTLGQVSVPPPITLTHPHPSCNLNAKVQRFKDHGCIKKKKTPNEYKSFIHLFSQLFIIIITLVRFLVPFTKII